MTEQIKAFGKKEKYTLSDIRELVAILRSDDGCAWDREQTHQSVRNAMIEETYEFIEGLDKNDQTLMREESSVSVLRFVPEISLSVRLLLRERQS